MNIKLTGDGFYPVSRSELFKLKIAHLITGFSFEDGRDENTVWLKLGPDLELYLYRKYFAYVPEFTVQYSDEYLEPHRFRMQSFKKRWYEICVL